MKKGIMITHYAVCIMTKYDQTWHIMINTWSIMIILGSYMATEALFDWPFLSNAFTFQTINQIIPEWDISEKGNIKTSKTYVQIWDYA